MKKLLILLALLPFTINAQEITLEHDTIYKDKVAYGLVTKTGKMGNAIYSVKTLTNVEIAVVKFDDATQAPGETNGYHRFTFLGTGAFGHFYPGMNIAKGIAKVVVENDLIKDNAVNPEGEKRFLALYPNQIKNQPTVIVNVNNNNSPDYTPVARNKFGSVLAINGKLSQSNTTIGSYTTTTDFSGGKSIATTYFTLPNSVHCASATYDNIGAKSASVRTMRDNVTRTITITNSANCEQEIANWLSTNGYL